ncbi:winged helix-turn-helix domain-containing protein [Verrucomicrobiota bacterium]
MRPIATRQDALQFPLNALLGTEADVRLLRVLADEVDGSLSVSDIAARTGLTLAGAWKATSRLVDSGVVRDVSAGSSKQYVLCRGMPVIDGLVLLFEREQKRYAKLVRSLKQIARQMSPQPEALWIQESPAEPGDCLTLGLLQNSNHISKSVSEFRQLLTNIEQEFDVTIEVNSYTRADLPNVNTAGNAPLFGMLPQSRTASKSAVSREHGHAKLERRSLERCRTLVSLIRKDRSLIRRARGHVKRMLEEGQGTADNDLQEWRTILQSYSLQRLRLFLISESPRATRLRQSCPLFAVLNKKERNRIVESERSRK